MRDVDRIRAIPTLTDYESTWKEERNGKGIEWEYLWELFQLPLRIGRQGMKSLSCDELRVELLGRRVREWRTDIPARISKERKWRKRKRNLNNVMRGEIRFSSVVIECWRRWQTEGRNSRGENRPECLEVLESAVLRMKWERHSLERHWTIRAWSGPSPP